MNVYARITKAQEKSMYKNRPLILKQSEYSQF